MSVEQEYADLDPLETRIRTHRSHSEKPDDVESAVYTTIEERLGTSLLDVGCGNGSFLKRLRSWGFTGELFGLDTSDAAVARVASEGIAAAVHGSATRLPFDSERFSTVTARHMLYHVADPQAALHEFARVVEPAGQVAVSVNHGSTVPHITALVHEQLVRHGVTPASLAAYVDSDDLPDLMSGVFTDVEMTGFDNTLVFSDPEPLIRFAVAVLGVYGLSRDAEVRPAVINGITEDVTAWFRRNSSPWRDPKGYVVCTGRVSRGR